MWGPVPRNRRKCPAKNNSIRTQISNLTVASSNWTVWVKKAAAQKYGEKKTVRKEDCKTQDRFRRSHPVFASRIPLSVVAKSLEFERVRVLNRRRKLQRFSPERSMAKSVKRLGNSSIPPTSDRRLLKFKEFISHKPNNKTWFPDCCVSKKD